MVLPGCFYIAPVQQTPDNEPPVIISPVDLTNDYVMQTDPARFDVLAYDAEQDDVYFTWDVPHDVEVFEEPVVQDGDYRLSAIRVTRDPVLDGDQIKCVVSDAANPQRTVVVIWNITVEQ